MNIPRTFRLSAVALLFIISLLFLMTTVATAQTPSRAPVETVTTLADSGAGSLRQAVADVDAGGTIIFDNSISGDTITLASEIDLNKNLTISGTVPITISGGGATHIFDVGGNATVQLDGLTLRDGETLFGAGGAIGVSSATLLIYNSTFHNNNSSNGGAIQGGSSFSLVISSTTFLENSASTGGAIEQNGSNAFITIVDSTFDGNQATNGFGGHIQYNGAIVDIGNSTFQNGTAGGGGAIYVRNNDLTIRNSTFSGNSAGANGGGALLFRQGGDPPNIVIENTTITDNSTTSGGVGGGIRMFNVNGSFNVTLRNTLVAGNTSGGDCVNEGNVAVFTADAFNLDSDGSCDNATTAADPLLGSLQNNGGATETHALLTGSPALDAGDNATCLATDQRGVARPQGATCDIGAYESDPCAVQPYLVSDTTTLNDAITCFNAATVAGTYTISFTADISLTAATTTINNATADIDLLIEGNDFTLDGQDSVRGLTIETDTDVTIDELTIRNGLGSALLCPVSPCGGAIYSQGTLTLTNGTLRSNAAQFGGGLYNNGPLTISNTTFITNTATRGGAMFNDANVPITINNSDFTDNAAVEIGGGILSLDTLMIDGSSFSQNRAGAGGAIYSEFDSSPIQNSYFAGNMATTGDGGAIFGTIDMQNSTVVSNTAANDGGGIFSDSLTLNNSTVAYNSADGNGGGIYLDGTSTSPINNSTISHNSAVNQGGGIYGEFRMFLDNATLSDNSANEGGGVYVFLQIIYANTIIANSLNGGDCVASGTFTNQNNLVEDGSCSATLSGDPNLGPLQNNGGATETHALLPFSPALEAGDNVTCLATDQRGVARPQGAACDIGAYEAEQPICTDNPASVSTEGELNDAIFCFNAATVAETYTISFTADITLTMASTTINNATAGIDLLIEGNGFALDGNDSERGLTIAADTNVAIENLTVRNGNRNNGGGIRNSGTLTISNSTVSGNSADNSSSGGGGIFNIVGTLTINNSTVSGNSADNNAGGIFNSGGTLTISNSTVSGNSADNSGGGIFNDNGTLTISNSTVSGNLADNSGGGISNDNGTLTISNSTVSGNSADNHTGGGGILNRDGTLTISNSTVSGNSADNSGGGGGGILNGGTLTISNSTVSGNSADNSGGGGGILNGGTLTINNSTVSGNSADNGGGIVNETNGTLEMSNSIIANSIDGGDCVNNSGSFNINVNNLIEDGTCNPALTGDPLLGSLQNNGGATETHALLPFSPALNAGDNATCELTDQRGVARPQGAACDIGAYEAETPICTDTLYPVSDTSELNDAIFCFNAATVAETYTISFTADITLTMASTTINNATADIDLLMAGNGFALDGNDSVRGLTIAADTHVAIENLTVRNGNRNNGGGIRNSGTLTISNSTVSGNSADNSLDGGGGIRNNGGTLTISNSTISGNSANNSSPGGGGIRNNGGTLTISNSTISGNSADNSVGGGGGGIRNNGGTLTISNSTISGNSADNRPGGGGGGIYHGSGTLTISNSTLYDNRSNRGGGIVYSQGIITLTHVTLDSNRGRGIAEISQSANATVTLQNSIVSNSLNLAGTASVANCVDTNAVNITADSSNMATDNTCDSATVVADVLLGPLQDNGGPTETQALLPFSPALEAADNATCLATDQRGVARPQGAACDIGAYEAEPPICTDNPASVSTEAELNDAIACFNDATVAGTYTISFTDNISLTAATTTISNTVAGIDLLIAGNDFALDGQDSERGLTIAIDTNVTVDDLTIQHGNETNGGAISNLGQLTIVNSRLISNTFGRRGGAIHNLGTLTVLSSVLSNNVASSGPAGLFGGAIYSTNRALVVDSLIENNRISDSSGATYGGGIYAVGGTLEVVSTTLRGNSAQFSGGAIYAVSSAVVTVTQSILVSNTISNQFGGGVGALRATLTISATEIVSNSAQTQGGGIYVDDGPLTLVNSTVAHNTANLGGGLYFNDEVDGHPLVMRGTTINDNVAASDGGGLAISSVGTMEIVNSTISGNRAERGGGIRTGTGTLVLNNVTLTANEADDNPDNFGDGGGIYDPIAADIRLRNTIVAGNLVGGSPSADADCSGPGFVSDGNNLLGDGTGCPVGASDIATNDPLLGPLQNNGGATETHAPLPGSPALNAGDNASCEVTDQRGVARPQGATCDIGAFELELVDLRLSKDDGGVSVEPGDLVTYTLTYTNVGDSDVTGVTITETVPAYTTFNAANSTAGWSCVPDGSANSICTLVVGTIAASGTGTVTFGVRVDTPYNPAGNQFTNTATIGDDGTNGPEATPIDNTASDTTPVINAVPDLVVTKQDSGATFLPGETISYTIVVSNTGNRIAPSVTVSETVPAHTVFNSTASSGFTCNPSSGVAGTNCTIQVGNVGSDPVTVTFAVDVVSDLSVGVTSTTNVVDVYSTSQFAEDRSNNRGRDDSQLKSTITAGELTVEKVASSDLVVAGEMLTYTITISNSSPLSATGITVSDTLPANTSFVDGSVTLMPPDGGATLAATSADLPTLASNLTIGSGQQIVLTYRVIVDAGFDGTVTNIADASGGRLDPTVSFADSVSTAVVNPQYGIADGSVVEGDSGSADLTFTITRTDSSVSGSVVISTTDGSASDGSDYTGISETVTFAVGEASRTVTVTVQGDTDVEPDETLTATLSNAVNGVIVDGSAVGTILNDDDVAPEVTDHRPISDAIDVPVTANVVVTFSEPVSVTSPITLNCDGIDRATTQTMPSAATVELTPDQPLPPGELCVVTVPFDAVEDDDTLDPPDNLAATYVFSFTTAIADSPPSGSLRIEAFTYQADPTDNVPNGNLDGFIMLKNVGNAPINVQGFMVGDEETAGGDEGMFVLPGHTLAVSETLIIAEDADLYAFGGTPDYSFAPNSVGVPVLQPATRWSNGAVNLDDSSDEVILLNNDFLLEDGACWGVQDAECVVDNSASRAQYRLLDDGRLVDNANFAGYQRVVPQDTNLQADWITSQTAVTLRTTQVSVVGIGRSLIITLTIGLFWLTRRKVLQPARTK